MMLLFPNVLYILIVGWVISVLGLGLGGEWMTQPQSARLETN